MERLPAGGPGRPHAARARRRIRPHRTWGRAVLLTGAAGLAAVALPATAASPASAAVPRSLKQTLAKADRLSNEIDSLGQQADGLKIQLAQAHREVKIARQTQQRDEKLLGASRAAVGQVAAVGYMSGGVSTDAAAAAGHRPADAAEPCLRS